MSFRAFASRETPFDTSDDFLSFSFVGFGKVPQRKPRKDVQRGAKGDDAQPPPLHRASTAKIPDSTWRMRLGGQRPSPGAHEIGTPISTARSDSVPAPVSAPEFGVPIGMNSALAPTRRSPARVDSGGKVGCQQLHPVPIAIAQGKRNTKAPTIRLTPTYANGKAQRDVRSTRSPRASRPERSR